MLLKAVCTNNLSLVESAYADHVTYLMPFHASICEEFVPADTKKNKTRTV